MRPVEHSLRIRLGCAVFLLALGWAGREALAEPIYSLTHLSRQAGLPQSSVRAVAVDSRGFLWIGTEKGIARYDGYRFDEIASPLNSGVVVKLHVDARDRVWTRWYGKPATMYDPAHDRWTVLTTLPSSSPDYFGELLETPDGRLWFTTNDRLYLFDEGRQQLAAAAQLAPEPELRYEQQYAPRLTYFQDAVWVAGHGEVLRVGVGSGASQARIPVEGAAIVRLWVHDDALWLCNSAGVFELQLPAMTWSRFAAAPRAGMTSCLFDADGALWMGFAGSGIARVRPGQLQWIVHPGTGSRVDHTTLASNHVINLQQDSRGQVWAITPGVAHRWTGTRFERFEFSPDSQPDNPGGFATDTFVEDRNGVLWFGSEDRGLARLSPFARKARWLAPPSQGSTHVRAVVIDREDNVWMGMNQDGVYRWNRESSSWTHFGADARDASQLPTREVRALFISGAGEIWAGSQRGGIVSRFDPRRETWNRHDLGSPGLVFNFLELPDGQLLIGRESGVTLFDPRSRRSAHFDLPGTPVRAMLRSATGRIYLGTHQQGLLEWSRLQGFGHPFDGVLSDRNVFALHEDREGSLWVGTWGGGLNRLRPGTREVQVLSTRDGLPDNTVFGILPGRHDDLWVSTNNGLAHIENCIGRSWPCTPKITVLDTNAGLPFSEFDAEAHALAPDGSLLFGGYSGLLRLDPDRLEMNRRPPVLQISAIQVQNRDLPWSRWSADTLELPHDFGGLRVRFSALDLNEPGNSRYQYRLGGREWLSLGANPELVLTDLAPGNHRLELQGSNSDGIPAARPFELRLRVAPPWYSSSVAWVLYALCAALGLWTLVQWRERRLRANAALLEATVAARTRELAEATHARDEFYANVSHEIRTPLALLTSTAEQLRAPQDARTQIALAADLVRHSDRLRRYVESLITVSHLQSSAAICWMREDMAQYLRSLVADFARLAGPTRIDLRSPATEIFVRSYPNALDTIFTNLLLNAIRHTPPGGTIRLAVEAGHDGARITLCDSGAGIDPALLPRLFDRGSRGSPSPHTAGGHGIGLNLVQQTILALGGSISARNAPDGGACFTITLPQASPELPLAAYARQALPEEPGADSRAARRATQAGRRRGSVLVIEDHDELRAQIADLLATHYRVREAATAQAGLSLAKQHLPDVVICDVMLPDGDGFEVVAALKAEALTEHISVVLLTALADETSRLAGLTAQADLYVTKPFSRDALLLQVDNLMEQRRRLRRAAARETWAARASSQPPAARAAGFEQRLLAALSDLHSNPECDVERLAAHLALSRKQLERKTRYCFQCSPKLLLNRYRLDQARVLLAAGVRVGEVAARCGFANPSHFGVLFKRRFGHSPSRADSVGVE